MTDKKIELSTTMCISDVKAWNAKLQRVNKTYKDADSVNAYLDSFHSKVLDCYSKLFVEGKIITADILREKPKTLMEIVVEHNELFEKRIGIDVSYGSYKNYKTTKKYLADFVQHQYKRKDIAINDVRHSFCERYFTYLTTVKPCNNNGANKRLHAVQ